MQLKAQIRNKAKDVGTTPQLMMQNYLLERILERISLSHWRDNVVIKGGVLISSLIGVDKRSTYDLDATVQGFPLTHENAEKAFREIIAVDADDAFSFGTDPAVNNCYAAISKEIHQTLKGRFNLYNAFQDVLFK